jgi:hypothetical protein
MRVFLQDSSSSTRRRKALSSARYTRDFNEVKALGSATSTRRTAAQTNTALFYSGLANVQFQDMLRDQVTVRDPDIVDAARTPPIRNTRAATTDLAWLFGQVATSQIT